MQKVSLGALWAEGIRSLRRTVYRRHSRDRIALLMRIENTALLTDRLGQAGLAHLFAQLSLRMIGTIRPHDFVQSTSPGVFTILLRTRSEVEAMRIAQRLHDNCQHEFQVCGMTIVPVVSGLLVQNTGLRHVLVRQLMACGHARLRRLAADEIGRIQLIAYQDTGLIDNIPATVADAVAAGQIEAYFQPQICCDTGRVTGFESLARWNHPSRGLLTPMDFMPTMGEVDHTALTRSMLRQSLQALQLWDAQGWDVPTVSLNVPQTELSNPAFVDSVLWELDRMNIPRGRLVIEVLESIGPINSGDQIRKNLARLSQAGCLLDLDDFGTGYASLESLRHFGVNRIKIDRAFITDCHRDPKQQRMIQAILAMAERLDVATLAEGVETADEHSYLAQIGCCHVQGYAIARPMPLGDVGSFMTRMQKDYDQLPDLSRRKA